MIALGQGDHPPYTHRGKSNTTHEGRKSDELQHGISRLYWREFERNSV
jgi:hypothetical protein